MKHIIGNDLVDLNTPDAKNYPKKQRFIQRVLCDSEQEFYKGHQYYRTIFWILWSAKEAVYKIVKKFHQEAVFAHKLYVCEINFLSNEFASGFVTYNNLKYPVTFSITPNWVHCIATTSNHKGKIIFRIMANSEIKSTEIKFSEEELASIHSIESSLVRHLTKDILKKVTGKDFEIKRARLLKKFAPPELWLDQKRVPDIDISMSHDGKYCATSFNLN
jgi:phosphopantetheinyl transferase (holo-ACP synthase)